MRQFSFSSMDYAAKKKDDQARVSGGDVSHRAVHERKKRAG